jgi:hypothetical protein
VHNFPAEELLYFDNDGKPAAPARFKAVLAFG